MLSPERPLTTGAPAHASMLHFATEGSSSSSPDSACPSSRNAWVGRLFMRTIEH
jgi:hypothetical protein